MAVLRMVVFCIPVLGCADMLPQAKPEIAPEVRWAQGLGEDFWAACLNGHPEQFSPELTRAVLRYERWERWGGVGGELKDVPPRPVRSWSD